MQYFTYVEICPRHTAPTVVTAPGCGLPCSTSHTLCPYETCFLFAAHDLLHRGRHSLLAGEHWPPWRRRCKSTQQNEGPIVFLNPEKAGKLTSKMFLTSMYQAPCVCRRKRDFWFFCVFQKLSFECQEANTSHMELRLQG